MLELTQDLKSKQKEKNIQKLAENFMSVKN
jgi:hypothetical protein